MKRNRKNKGAKDYCDRWNMILNPETGEEEPSKTHKGLLDSIGDRPLANYIYARSRTKAVKDAMDKIGYKRNAQGEHTSKNIKMYFNLYKILREKVSNENEMIENGFKAVDGTYIKFSVGSDAIDKAIKYNSEHEYKVAIVKQLGSNFIITVEDKNANTLDAVLDMQKTISNWTSLYSEFEKLGIDLKDIENINPEAINPLTIKKLTKDWKRMIKRNPENFGQQSMQILLELTKSNPLVQQAMKNYGEDLSVVADKMVKAFNDKSSVPEGEYSFLLNVVNSSKQQLEKMDIAKIIDIAEVNAGFQDFSVSQEDAETQMILKMMNDKYHINHTVILKTSNEIKSLSDAALFTMQNLKRQINNLKNLPKKKVTEYTQKQIKELQDTMELLSKEYKSKNFYTGLTVALSQVAEYTKTLDKVVESLEDKTEGTFIERMAVKGDKLMKLKNIHDGYMDIVLALSTMNTIASDEFISEQELNKLKDLANTLHKVLSHYNQVFTSQAKRILMDVAFKYIGSDAKYDGQSITEGVDSMDEESLWNYLYSIARNKNKLVAVLGGVVRDMQRERNQELMNIEKEINRATQALYKKDKKVKNTSFVYEKVGEDGKGNFKYEAIASPYNWDDFNKARSAFFWTLVNDGKSDAEIAAEMDDYDQKNTKKIMLYGYEVTVPIDVFKKDYDFQRGWSDAQKEYYDSMMRIKVRLHEMMPDYAKYVYLAPQIRKSPQQFTNEFFEGKITFRQYINALLRDIAAWKIKADDTRYSKNGMDNEEILVNGEKYVTLNTTFNNNKIRTVPMFYVKGLPDSYELLHDFSEATLKLATQALNYSKLTKIQNLVEIMADYLRQVPTNEKFQGKRVGDKIAIDKDTTLLRNVVKYAKQNKTAKIIEGFLQAQMYGRADDPTQFSVFTNTMLKVTALRALTLNTLGAANNWLVGELQNIIEACAGEFFNLVDYAWANVQLFTKMNIMDLLTNNVNSMAGLLERRFDPAQDYYRDMQDKKYFKTFLGRVFGGFDAFGMYQVGEYIIHMKNMYAMINHTKVLWNGKKVSLSKVLKKANKRDGNSELYIEDNVTTLDGRLLVSLEDEFFNALQRRIEYVNSRCHGAMNPEDKGAISYNDIGRLAMSFRQWMIGHYSRRYRTLYWDSTSRDPDLQNFYYDNKVYIEGKKHPLYDAFEKVYSEDPNDPTFTLKLRDDVEITYKEGDNYLKVDKTYVDAIFDAYLTSIGYREGFDVTMLKFLNDTTVAIGKEYRKTVAEAKEDMTSAQKYNVKRFWASVATYLFCWGYNIIRTDPNDEDDKLARWWKYEMMRLFMEEKASSPIGMVLESNKIINTPLPMLSVLWGFAYPIIGLIDGDYKKTVNKGKFAGQNKYWATIKKRTFPFSLIGDIEGIIYEIREGIDEDRFKVGQRNYKSY